MVFNVYFIAEKPKKVVNLKEPHFMILPLRHWMGYW